MIKLLVIMYLPIATFCNTLRTQPSIAETPDKATCTCDLQMKIHWRKVFLANIFKREISAWGQGSNQCVRIREGCRILCEIMGRKYVQARAMNGNCQGTKLGQRLCELYSNRYGYEEITAPGRHVAVNYRLNRCWTNRKDYLQAFRIQGNLCCSAISPFKQLPYVKLMVWNGTCSNDVKKRRIREFEYE